MSIATIEILQNITVRQGDQVEVWEAGSLVVLPLAQAELIMRCAGPRVRLIKNRAVHPMVGSAVLLEDKLKPWIVTGASDEATDRSLLLVDFAEDACFKREADVHPYRCPTCSGSSVWWDTNGIWCAACVRPQPRWDRLWAELQHLTKDLVTNPNRTLLQAELDAANEAFSQGHYPNFQKALVRARWGMPETSRRIS